MAMMSLDHCPFLVPLVESFNNCDAPNTQPIHWCSLVADTIDTSLAARHTNG